MKKRGQGVEHLALYIMLAVVTILIIGIGYKALAGGKDRYYKSTIIDFSVKLEKDIHSIQRNYGSVVEKTYSLHPSMKMVCMSSPSCGYIGGCWDDASPLVEQMISEGNNVFLLEDKNSIPTPFKIGSLALEAKSHAPGGAEQTLYFRTLCFPTNGGKIYLQLEGAGRKTIVRPVWPVSSSYGVEYKPIFYCKVGGKIQYELPGENYCKIGSEKNRED